LLEPGDKRRDDTLHVWPRRRASAAVAKVAKYINGLICEPVLLNGFPGYRR
jgi:hypothetical protein